MKRKQIFILLAAFALSLAACAGNNKKSSSVPAGDSSSNAPSAQSSGQGEETVAVTGITLNKETLSLEEGQSETLTKTVAPANASDTSVTWASSNAAVATVSNLGKVTAVKVGTATITCTSKSNPAVSASCAVTVTEEGGKYGSVNKPKTVAQALAIARGELSDTVKQTAGEIYVKGFVSKAPTYNATKGYSSNIYLKDALTDADDKAFLVYSANHDALKVPYQNDEIIVHGYVKDYNGTIEMATVTIDNASKYAEIDAVTRGTSTISYSVEHGSFNEAAPKSGKNNSEFTFTVTPDQGYQVNSVSINGEAIEAEADGSYKAVIKGNTTVLADIGQEGVEVLNATMEYPANDNDSTNMTGGNDATLLSLDETLFSVVSDNPTGLYAGLNKAGNFRLYNGYANATDKTKGTQIVVSSVRAKVLKIAVTLAGSTVAGLDKLEVKAGEEVVTGNDGVYEINNGKFSLKNVSNAEVSDQIHITKVVISYSMNQEVAATDISLDHPTLEIEAGKKAQLSATLVPSNATDVVVWSSSDNNIATVDQTGRVTAVAEGEATITAKVSDTIKATCVVTVQPAEVIDYGTAEKPLTVAKAKAVMDKTGTDNSAQPIFVKGVVSTNTAFTTYGNYDEVWLQSDDGSEAKALELYRVKLDESIEGDYTAADALKGFEVVASGYGKIFREVYELNPANGTNPLILSIKAPSATGVELNKETLALAIGGSETLVATLKPNGAQGTVAWGTSDAAVATVDANGKVTAVAAGTATIYAFIDADGDGAYDEGEINAQCAVTVSAAENHATSVTLDKVSGELFVGGTATLTATVLPEDSTDTVVWSSSDGSVATVDQTGKITAVAAGTATITATAGPVHADYVLTVTVEHGSVVTDPLTVEQALAMGAELEGGAKTERQYYIKGTVYQIDDNSLSKSFNNATFWLYAGEGVKGFEGYRMKPLASVPSEDYDKFVVGCEVVIVCNIKNYVKNDVSTIENDGGNIISIASKTTAPTSIALDKNELELEEGGVATLKASFTPSFASATVIWTSSDDSVATVDQTGKVTAVAAGTAKISAFIDADGDGALDEGELKAECSLTVTAASGGEQQTSGTLFTANLTSEMSVDKAGYTITNNKTSKKDAGYYQDTGTADSDVCYFIVKGTSPLFTSEPSKITLTANLGAGSDKDPLDHNVEACLVDSEGNEIAATKVTVTSALTKDPAVYTVEIPYSADAYGVKLSHMKENSWNARYYSFSLAIEMGGGSTPVDSTPLPVIAAGNNPTKVEGAGAWIYLDNTSLGITGGNAADILATANITLTVAMSDETPEGSKDAAQHYITGADAAVVIDQANVRFDDYGEGTVRLYIAMDKGLAPEWKMQHTFVIELTIEGVTYSATVVFVGGALQA